MKKIAFHNQKGGVGKTTISGNVAHYCSRKKKTILIDADPQGNASSWLLRDAPRYELADALLGDIEAREAIIEVNGLSLIPTFSINGKLKSYSETKLFQEPFIFQDLCEALGALGYELIIFDLSPGMSQLERAVISACDEAIVPVNAEFFSIDGIETFSNELQKLNKNYRREVKHNKLVCNALNLSFSRHREIYKEFQSLNYELFTIPQDARLAECQLLHKSIFEYAPESKSIPELERLGGAVWA